jgi:hypothetical protein
VNYGGVLSKTDEDQGGNTKSGYMIFDHFDSFGAERNDGILNHKVETGALTTGVWKYVVVTFDGITLTLYIDGQSQDSSATPIVSIPATTNGFVLGGRNGGNFLHYAGVIDEVAVYDKALSPARIDAHRRAALAP